MWTMVTMDDAPWWRSAGGMPPSYPNYCATWIERSPTEGRSFSTTPNATTAQHGSEGTRFPMSTMPGEQVTTCSPQMGPETLPSRVGEFGSIGPDGVGGSARA